MGRLFRFVVSGKSVAELKENMSKALNELNGEETTASLQSQGTAELKTFRVPSDDDINAAYLEPAKSDGHLAPNAFPGPIPGAPVHIGVDPSFASANSKLGVDSMGFPWDERIHSVNAAKNKNGSWRTRRGVEPAYVKQIEHELLSKIKSGEIAQPAPPPVALPQVAPAPTLPPLQFVAPVAPQPLGNAFTPPVPLTAPVAAAPQPSAAPIAPSIVTNVAPAPAAPAPFTSAHSLQTFTAQFVPTLSHLVAEGKLTPEYVAALKNYFRIEQIYDANDAQKAEMFETFCNAGLLTKVG